MSKTNKWLPGAGFLGAPPISLKREGPHAIRAAAADKTRKSKNKKHNEHE